MLCHMCPSRPAAHQRRESAGPGTCSTHHCGTSVTPRYPTVPRPRMGSTSAMTHAGSRHQMGPAKRYLRPAKRYLRTAKPYLRCRHCRRQSARGLQKKELAPPSLPTLSHGKNFGCYEYRVNRIRRDKLTTLPHSSQIQHVRSAPASLCLCVGLSLCCFSAPRLLRAADVLRRRLPAPLPSAADNPPSLQP